MSVYVMMAMSFLPLLCIFVIFRFTVSGFKVRYGLLAILLGLLSLVPIVIIQSFVRNLPVFTSNTLLAALITALLFNGLIEESMKMVVLFLLPAKKMNFSTFFTLSLVAGLALGCFETVIYLFSGYLDIEVRTATAVVMHCLCTGLSGVSVWLWKNPAEQKKIAWAPWLWAVLLHGSYNFFAGFSGFYRWFSLATIMLTALESRIWYKKIGGIEGEENTADSPQDPS